VVLQASGLLIQASWLVAAQILAWVLLSAGIDKAVHFDRFAGDVVREPWATKIPRTMRVTAAATVVIVETLLGILALLGIGGPWVFQAAAILLAGLTVVLLVHIFTRRVERCGCGGIIGAFGAGPGHLAANCVLAATAIGLGTRAEAPGTGLSPLETGLIGGTVALSLLLVRAILALRSLRTQRRLIDKARFA
jgi:uncharacterized membrane protein YphA (DoxX/SURF4 family)